MELEDFENTIIYIIAGASTAIGFSLVVLYWTWRCRKRGETPRSRGNMSAQDLSAESHSKPPSTHKGTMSGWGPQLAYGIDLGSFNLKTHSCKTGNVQQAPSLRCVVTLTSEGLSMNVVEDALERPGSSMLSVVSDFARRPHTALSLADTSFPVAQVLAAMLGVVCGDRDPMPLVGVSMAPYHGAEAAERLYSVAAAASLGRFFIFSQGAALTASLLKQRAMAAKSAKPSRTVVFADCGVSGVAAYVCEVREASGSVLTVLDRQHGVREAVDAMAKGLQEQCGGAAGLDRASEAAHTLREEFAALNEYLVQSGRKVSTTLGAARVELDLPLFQQWFAPCIDDVKAVADGVRDFLSQRVSGGSQEPVELVLTGGLFRLPAIRQAFETVLRARHVSYGKVSVSEGLALLTAMQHPQFSGQRYEVLPLHQLPTVESSRQRERLDHGPLNRTSFLSPLLRSSSRLGRRSSALPSMGTAGSASLHS